MIKLIPAIILCVGLILATNSNAYATSSQSAFGHVTINKGFIKLTPVFGPGGTHVKVFGKGFVSHYILDFTFTDSHNHVYRMGKILVNNHGEFIKPVIIPKTVSLGKGTISVKHNSSVLASAVFTVTKKNHNSDDDRKE